MLCLEKARTLWPDKLAVVDGNQRLTYRQFAAAVNHLARVLRQRGVGKNSAVAIAAPNCLGFLTTYYACASLEAVIVPLNYRLSPRELAYVLDHSASTLLLAHPLFEAPLRAAVAAQGQPVDLVWLAPPSNGPSMADEGIIDLDLPAEGESPTPGLGPASDSRQLAQLYYTSGTTGTPKGVMLSHGNVTFHALSTIAEFGLCDDDVWLHGAPLFHLADAWATFAITWVGGTHVCLPQFTAAGALDAMEREGVTITNLIPTMLTMMLADARVAERSYPRLRMLLSGGAPIAPATVERIVETFQCEYVQTYGMTETSPYLTVSLPPAAERHLPLGEQLATRCRTGRPFLGVQLKVVDDEGQQVPWNDRDVGEILAQGPTVTAGYWKDADTTAAAFDQGWLRTGDLAVVNHQGSLNIVDRKKDVIISGGENIYSTEVEHVLYEHPDILEAAVVGLPDELWGETVAAFVVAQAGTTLSEADVVDFCKSRLAHFKCPKQVNLLEGLPKTGSGKIAKNRLRSYCAQGS
jgi:acyl-CoA synthetase (AMP-forming)/AMP-acid ligase II